MQAANRVPSASDQTAFRTPAAALQSMGPYCAALCTAEVFASLAKPPPAAAAGGTAYGYAQLGKGRASSGDRRSEAGAEASCAATELLEDAAEEGRPARPTPRAMQLSGEQLQMLTA